MHEMRSEIGSSPSAIAGREVKGESERRGEGRTEGGLNISIGSQISVQCRGEVELRQSPLLSHVVHSLRGTNFLTRTDDDPPKRLERRSAHFARSVELAVVQEVDPDRE